MVCSDTSHSGVQLKDCQFGIWLGSFLFVPSFKVCFLPSFLKSIHLFLAALLAFSSCSKQELISACEHRFLVIVDSLVAGYGLWGSRASVAVACGQLIVVGTGLAAPQRVGSSRTKDRTCVSFFGRQIFAIESPGNPFPSFLIYYIFE